MSDWLHRPWQKIIITSSTHTYPDFTNDLRERKIEFFQNVSY
jgi:hypothetical protein